VHKSPLRRVSKRQTRELALRRKVKAELWAEQGDNHRCHCGRWFRSIGDAELSHKKHVAEGRVTSKATCELSCHLCHFGEGGHKTIMPNGWSAGKPDDKREV